VRKTLINSNTQVADGLGTQFSPGWSRSLFWSTSDRSAAIGDSEGKPEIDPSIEDLVRAFQNML